MRRETQKNLLFLIRRLCRIYSAATACVQQSRGLVAIRSTAFAAAACVADAICRVKAVDDPSAFALHYSGLCEGPTESYCIQAGSFDSLAANLPIYDPTMVSLRFRCLDYMRGLSKRLDGSDRKSIFNFDTSLTPNNGDIELITNLSIQLALPRPYPATKDALENHAASLITGKNGSIIEVLPEFANFRDIVFHFKHSVSGRSPTPANTEKHPWLPSDATLQWHARRRNKEDPTLEYHVTAFQDHHQAFVDNLATQKESKNAFAGFLSLFNKSGVERAKISSANATNVVNSCGEKFQKGRYDCSNGCDNVFV